MIEPPNSFERLQIRMVQLFSITPNENEKLIELCDLLDKKDEIISHNKLYHSALHESTEEIDKRIAHLSEDLQ